MSLWTHRLGCETDEHRAEVRKERRQLMKRWVAAGVAVLALWVAGCDTATETSCEPVPPTLRESLEDSLRGNRTLGQVYAVQSRDDFGGPGFLDGDAWFVTGDVQPNPGTSTWLVSDRAFRTGGGTIIGVSPSARAVSEAGDLVSLDAIGVDESSDGYQESVACFD
jgi:hypothetical protein